MAYIVFYAILLLKSQLYSHLNIFYNIVSITLITGVILCSQNVIFYSTIISSYHSYNISS